MSGPVAYMTAEHQPQYCILYSIVNVVYTYTLEDIVFTCYNMMSRQKADSTQKWRQVFIEDPYLLFIGLSICFSSAFALLHTPVV